MSERFSDPLEDLMNRAGQKGQPTENESVSSVTALPPTDTSSVSNEIPAFDTEVDDDPFGTHDREKELAAEDAAREAEREQRIQEARAAEEATAKVIMPPDPHDNARTMEDVDFQGTTLEIVANMVRQVAYKHNLHSGEIPVATEEDPDLRMHVMGDLVELYYRDGEKITPEFEDVVLRNWVGNVDPEAEAESNPETTPAKKDTATGAPIKQEPAQININVEGNTPVTVNVDDSVAAEIREVNKIDIVVTRTTKEELQGTTIIQNSQRDDIIVPYRSEMDDVPITLPMSAYRCVLRPVNYWEFIQLGSAPPSGSAADADKKQWSIIYDHIKNVSIGDFTDFEDFLKHTKYMDRELLMWGILIASSSEEETITIKCGNKKCQKQHQIKYSPRTLIHVNPDLIGKYEWETTGSVAPGPAAVAHHNKITSTVRRYKLPHSGVIVEIDDAPSAYDFINKRYPLMDALRERYTPTDDEIPEEFLKTYEDREKYINSVLSSSVEYSYLLAHVMFVNAISIIKEDGKEYRYTNWDDIEEIITKFLDMDDAAILLQLVKKLSSTNVSPMEFYLEDFTCDACKRHEDRIMIPDVGDSLIFQLSRRLSSTEINLIEMQSN